MLFTPVAGCRAFKQVKVLAKKTKNLQITGDGDFSNQGGPPTGCGIPASAQAVSISLTASSPAKGFLTAYPQGTARPKTNLLSYTPNEKNTAGATVLLNEAGRIKVYSKKTATVAGDITGYYAPQIWVYGSPNGNIIDASPRILSSTRINIGMYAVTVDRDVSSCAATASGDLSGYIISAYTDGSSVLVYIRDITGAYSDYWFNLQVMC